MARILITAEFEPDENDPMAKEYGPKGLHELLMEQGFSDIEINASDDGELDHAINPPTGAKLKKPGK